MTAEHNGQALPCLASVIVARAYAGISIGVNTFRAENRHLRLNRAALLRNKLTHEPSQSF